ncbi:putative reverse transcriptase zinc-binding domain-containing protein [Helianthus anomalus]
MYEDLEVNNYVVKWSKWVPSKCSIFMWRSEMNKLPTLDALKRRNILIDSSTCSLCETADETVKHFIIGCEVANAVWSFVASRCKKYALQGIIIVASWSIWKARNEMIFRQKEVKIEEIIVNIRSFSFLSFKNRSKCKSISWTEWCSFSLM